MTETPAAADMPTSQPAPTVPNQSAKEKKLSALEAAATVLAESGQAMSCQELIVAMAAKGYWQSPKGRRAANTLYSALLRELQNKGASARFVKADRGKFRLRDMP